MRENKYTQCILCEGSTFQEAVDEFNYQMMKNAAYNPTFERAGEKFLIYIKVTEFQPETIVEAKHLEGCNHICAECSHCERMLNRKGSIDKRTKVGYCIKNGTRRKIRTDSEACDTFYLEHQDNRKEVANG